MERLHIEPTNKLYARLRSLFGAIEDWNVLTVSHEKVITKLRSLFGAIEDWNI